MKAIAMKYGKWAGIAGALLFIGSFILGKSLSYDTAEVLGYIAIILPLLFIYFAIRHYRDQVNKGGISFKEGFFLGMLVTLCVAIAISLSDLLITSVLYPDFIDEYTVHQLSVLEEKLSPEEFAIQKDSFLKDMEAYGTPLFMMLLMFVTVTILGFIITIVSSFMLKRKIA